jgi:hypothetical protein
MSVAASIARLRDLVEATEPTAKPGRRFRVVAEASPASARHMTILPLGITGQGTYTGPCYSPQYQVAIIGHYPKETTEAETRAIIVQDAVDLLRGITRPPNQAANPWHNVMLASHTVEPPDDDGLYYRSILVMEVEQA